MHGQFGCLRPYEDWLINQSIPTVARRAALPGLVENGNHSKAPLVDWKADTPSAASGSIHPESWSRVSVCVCAFVLAANVGS